MWQCHRDLPFHSLVFVDEPRIDSVELKQPVQPSKDGSGKKRNQRGFSTTPKIHTMHMHEIYRLPNFVLTTQLLSLEDC